MGFQIEVMMGFRLLILLDFGLEVAHKWRPILVALLMARARKVLVMSHCQISLLHYGQD